MSGADRSCARALRAAALAACALASILLRYQGRQIGVRGAGTRTGTGLHTVCCGVVIDGGLAPQRSGPLAEVPIGDVTPWPRHSDRPSKFFVQHHEEDVGGAVRAFGDISW